jgi:hypothetical protein
MDFAATTPLIKEAAPPSDRAGQILTHAGMVELRDCAEIILSIDRLLR